MLIAQISDLHVRPRGVLYQGVVDSNRRLGEALEHLSRLDRSPDLLLVTGDLVDEGRPDEYAMARELLAATDMPVLVTPGNHDGREALRQAFHDHAYLPPSGPLHWCVDDFPVRIIGLDTCVDGAHHGELDRDGLAWLETTLETAAAKPTIVALHHPPFVCGIPYLDAYRYLDPAPLARIIEQAPQVQLVTFGHVHRTMLRRWAGTVACACPSTVTEIDLQLRADAPPSSHVGPRGCMLHLWTGDGLVTHVSPIGVAAGPYPFA